MYVDFKQTHLCHQTLFIPYLSCRLAFKVEIQHAITDKDYVNTVLPKLRVYKNKTREGLVERVRRRITVLQHFLSATFKAVVNAFV